jgi:ribosome-associated translation inhibitor RaiA
MGEQNHVVTINESNEEVLGFANNSLRTMMSKAPSDSFVKMSIETARSGTKVIIALSSLPLRTTVSKFAKSPFLAIEKALNELEVSLKKWKAVRFEQS